MPLVLHATRSPVRCAVCHDTPGNAELVPCPRCGAALHAECWSWLAEHCPTQGCARRPAAIRLVLTPRRRALHWGAIRWALALLAGLGLLAVLYAEYTASCAPICGSIF